MKSISIDIESFSSVNLQKSGVYRYAESDDFEILLFGYSVDGGEVQVVDLARGEKISQEIISALTDDSVIKWAFNAQFERICLSKWLGLPDGTYLSPKSWHCTMIWAATLGLPLSLEGVGAVLGLEKQKLSEGKNLIKYFCIPCSPTKTNGGRTRNLPHHDIEKWEMFISYNKRDVEAEMAIQNKLSKFPVSKTEWQNYHLDQIINDRGINLDMDFVNQAISCDKKFKVENIEKAKEITGLENPNSPAQLKDWLLEQGMETESLSKAAVSELLENADGELHEALSIRQQLAKSSVKKYTAMENVVCSDSRARGLIQFYGANRTGRYSGRLIQVQNLPQNHLPDLKQARSLVKDGNFTALDLLYDSIPNVLSELIRTAFVPKSGCRFVVADFSAIEARVIAWLAGEQWRMDVFANGGDIYCASASQMFNVPVEKNGINGHLRQKGKQAELACIAHDSLVLTDKGLVPIQDVTTKHKLWDGEEWIKHDGVISKGEKEVITYGGLTATKDHLVWVKGKSRPIQFGEAATSKAYLIQTGNGRKAIWLGEDNKCGEEMEFKDESLLCFNRMYGLSQYTVAKSKQLKIWKIKRLPEMFSTEDDTFMATKKTYCCKATLRESKYKELSLIWWKRHQIQFFLSSQCRNMDIGKCRKCTPRFRDGQDRQQWKLRRGQYSFCCKKYKSSQQKNISNPRFQTRKLALCKKCCYKNAIRWNDKRRNYSSSRIGSYRKEKKLEINPSKVRVYDILNTGKNHRFTVSNVLVHNCGYGGSIGALKSMGAIQMGLSEEELQPLVNAWRKSNPNIVRLWWDVDKAVKTSIKERTTITTHGIEFIYQSGILFIRLPSGRRLAYVKPLIGENRFGGESVTYEGVGSTKKWERIESYGPKFVENIVQAISRDILAEAMLRLAAHGFEIVMHVHDEVVLEVPVGKSSIEEVCRIMSETPTWAKGLILNADGYECEFYKKE